MAFDIGKIEGLERKVSVAKITTWQEAKSKSLTTDYDAQAANVKKGAFNVPGSGSRKWGNYVPPKNPSCWVMKRGDEYYLSWRIMNKPVYLTEELENSRNGWIRSQNSDPEKGFSELRDFISSGNADTQIQKAFERRLKRKTKKEPEVELGEAV